MTERDVSAAQRGRPQPRLCFEIRSRFASRPHGGGDQPSDPIGVKATAICDPGLSVALAPGPPAGLRRRGTLHILVTNGPATGPQYRTGQVVQPVTDGGENSLVAPNVRWG